MANGTDNQGLDVHDVQVSTQTTLNAQNKAQQAFIVQFSVGSHGPFTESVLKSGDPQKDAAAIKTVINNQVQLLRLVTHPELG